MDRLVEAAQADRRSRLAQTVEDDLLAANDAEED